MTRQPVSDLSAMLAGMAPVLDREAWYFVVVEGTPPTPELRDALANAFAIIREDEGVTAIVSGERAGMPFARITLMVHSALKGVGLTAAVSGALAEAGIACNIIAGYYHDHLFVPWARRDAALAILQRLSGTG
ncbi:ACT domain-containing protein [Erythrobacter sanguineus]|uniref:Uncharacterized protein n=1 Tax=Erythrobacter sanguineus TaxID=198312 RepID=A0A1M7RX87_9SPHN|nr:ACT domain-containing protein [Erythrobacter sanguineus]SHN50744.1 hypothetical protein SAMN02745193_00527 [Erythrobacter sanguineus]